MSKLTPVVLVPGIVLAVAARASVVTETGYQGHKILIWAIDKSSHGARGFGSQTIKPQQEVSSEPVSGYTIKFQAGPIETATVTDFRTETTEQQVPFRISHRNGSSQGTRSLTSPFLHLEYGTGEDLASVSIAVPIGTIRSRPLLDLVGRKLAGTTEELEDLLIAAASEPAYTDDIRTSDILEVYKLLGKSHRTDLWLRLLAEGNPRVKVMAAAVLTSLGNQRGTAAFCDACLGAQGNAQVGLVELLCMMPPSDQALATTVELIVSPAAFVTRLPNGAGAADIDRRYSLIRSLTEKYPRDRIIKQEKALRAWATSKHGKERGGRQVLELLDGRLP